MKKCNDSHEYKQAIIEHTFRDGDGNSGGWTDKYDKKIYCTRCGDIKVLDKKS